MLVRVILLIMISMCQRSSSFILRNAARPTFVNIRTWSSCGPTEHRQMHLSEEENVVYEQLVHQCKVKTASRILLCVSGGLDSMAMLHLVAAIQQKCMPSLSLQVVNFNHKLRPESDEEAQFVERWAKAYNLPFFLREMPPDMRKEAENKSIQRFARDWRRDECMLILKELQTINIEDGSGIATAHHSDDQVETMMLKLLRGAHVSKLYPILPRSECTNFIRPLLHLSKKQLESYMVTRDLEWREDASNQERKYTRNKVRLDLIPLMEAIAGDSASLKKRFMALGEQSLELHEWLHREAVKFVQSDQVEPKLFDYNDSCSNTAQSIRLTFSVDANQSHFAALPSMVKSEIIHMICHHLTGSSIDFAQTQKILSLSLQDLTNGAKIKSLRINDQWSVSKIGTILRFERVQRGKISADDHYQDLENGVMLKYPSWLNIIHRREIENEQITDPKKEEVLLKLYNLPTSALISFRYCKAGDSFQPSWRSSPIKITDFLRGRNIPVHQRDEILVALVNNEVAAVLLGPTVSGTYDDPQQNGIHVELLINVMSKE